MFQPDSTACDDSVRRRTSRVFVGVALTWIVAWFHETKGVLDLLLRSKPVAVEAHLFPGPLAIPEAAAVVYALPALAALCLWRLERIRAIVTATIFLGSTTFLLFHADFFTRAQYVVYFWVALWLLWLALHLNRTDDDLRPQAMMLAKTTVAMIFFCSALGKWTGGYWSGEILHDLYFLRNENGLYPWLRTSMEAEQLRSLATWHSRVVVIAESAIPLALFLRYRYFAIIAIGLATGTVATAGAGAGIGALMLAVCSIVIAAALLSPDTEETKRSSPFTPLFAGLSTLSISGRLLISAHAFCVAVVLLTSVASPLQKRMMMLHHLSEENRIAWALLHPIPKMYSFEHEYPVIEATSSGDDAPAMGDCFGGIETPRWFQHYPSRFVASAWCQGLFFDSPGPVNVVLQSHYRDTCLRSTLHVEAFDEGNEKRLVITSGEVTSDCRKSP